MAGGEGERSPRGGGADAGAADRGAGADVGAPSAGGAAAEGAPPAAPAAPPAAAAAKGGADAAGGGGAGGSIAADAGGAADAAAGDAAAGGEEPEPQLKYERLGCDVKGLLAGTAATCLALSDKVLALGTAAGSIHILDYSGNEVGACSGWWLMVGGVGWQRSRVAA
jgi:hypothetical protein